MIDCFVKRDKTMMQRTEKGENNERADGGRDERIRFRAKRAPLAIHEIVLSRHLIDPSLRPHT